VLNVRITGQEYRTRLANLQSQAAAHDLDAFLISSKDRVFYLKGVAGLLADVERKTGKPG
jgi:Xaa-Pro aminopeptidase